LPFNIPEISKKNKLFACFIVLLCIFNLPLNAQTIIPFTSISNGKNNAIEANADSLKIDSNSQKASFTGNVEIKHGSIILKAQKVIISYSTKKDSKREIKEFLATKDVVFILSNDVIKADEVLYNLQMNTIKLSGNIAIIQGTTSFSGNELVINLTTGEGTMSGQVKAILGSDEK
jgi:lipopolysaccharide export system protein LptA